MLLPLWHISTGSGGQIHNMPDIGLLNQPAWTHTCYFSLASLNCRNDSFRGRGRGNGGPCFQPYCSCGAPSLAERAITPAHWHCFWVRDQIRVAAVGTPSGFFLPRSETRLFARNACPCDLLPSIIRTPEERKLLITLASNMKHEVKKQGDVSQWDLPNV